MKQSEATTRGKADLQVTMFRLVTAEQLVAEDHPIRDIKSIVENALRELHLDADNRWLRARAVVSANLP